MIGIVPRRASLAAAALGILLAAACEDEIPPEQRVTTIEVSSGGNQQAVAGTALPQPVVVRALDAQGRAVRGAPIEWQVGAGNGMITPVDQRTDGEGLARANWTIGNTAVQQSATARIGTATVQVLATGVPGPAAMITITPATVMLDAIGATANLQALLRDQHDNPISGRNPAWSSTDESIVRVGTDGRVTAVSPGTATVRATLDGATGEAMVTVAPVPTFIAIVPPAPQLAAVGATVQLEALAQDRNGNPVEVPAENYVWTTTNALVADVTTTGLVTATGAGSALVRAALGNVVGEAQVTVVQTAASLTLNPKVDTLTTVKPFVQLAVTATDTNGQPIPNPMVTWTSSDATIASVSPTGVVTAVKNGTVVVRAVSGMARDSATIVVRLNAPPVAVADAYPTGVNTPLIVVAPGVLMNDTLGIPTATVVSFGGGSLGGSVTSNVAGATVAHGVDGSLRILGDGSITFTPTTGFMGTFTVQYRLQNAAGASDGTISIHVGTPPMAVDDAYMTTMNTPIAFGPPGLLNNDDRGFPLATITSFGGINLGGDVTAFNAGSQIAFGLGGFVGGLVRVLGDGSLEFTPPTGYTGTFQFRYRLTNGIGLTSDATISITVN
jgi:uncharacterized protein YjdB